MAQTPYAPPAARVSDPPEARGPVPASLRRAARFLWASFVLSVALAGLYLVDAVPSGNSTVDSVTTIVTAALIALIAVKVGAGRNWARWLFLVIYILGSVMFGVVLIVMPQAFLSMPGLLQVSALAQFTVQTCALVLMFTRPSRRWFQAPRAAASASVV